MANDILGMYGEEMEVAGSNPKPRATSGGVTSAKSLEYCKPVGPSNQMQVGPGIHGTNRPSGTQGKH